MFCPVTNEDALGEASQITAPNDPDVFAVGSSRVGSDGCGGMSGRDGSHGCAERLGQHGAHAFCITAECKNKPDDGCADSDECNQLHDVGKLEIPLECELP